MRDFSFPDASFINGRTMVHRFLPLSIIAGAVLLASIPVVAQENPTATPSPPTSESAKWFDPATATNQWLAAVPAEKRAKSNAYFEGGYWLALWNFLLAIAISIFLLSSRISARLRDFAERTTRFKALQVAFYAIPYFIIVALLSFPLAVYQGFYREHQYGLATQTFGPWFADQLKAFVLTLIFGSVALIILYAVFRRAPRTWPIWGTIVVVCLSLFGSFIAPVFVEPIFNTYKPLLDPKIRDPILAMARANEIPADKVFVVDASRQTTRISANVAGLFGTTRIALNDNLLRRCTLPEIREVMAHEMGHYVLNHGMKLTLYSGIFVLVGFFLTRALFDRAIKRWGERWGVRGIADPAGLPLLALILSVYFFVLTPISNTAVRVTEREADAFGINTCREPDGSAMVALKLGQYRKLDPSPIEEFVFFDHPSGRARIRMAMDWKAANLPAGESSIAPPGPVEPQ
jgi:STE24 endopeptidase